MNKTFLATLALVIAGSGLAVAQEAGAPSTARIAVIDMARISAESQLGKSYATQLEQLQNDINTAAQAKQTELQELVEKAQKDAAVMSETERRNAEKSVRDLQREVQRLETEFREDLNLEAIYLLGGFAVAVDGTTPKQINMCRRPRWRRPGRSRDRRSRTGEARRRRCAGC